MTTSTFAFIRTGIARTAVVAVAVAAVGLAAPHMADAAPRDGRNHMGCPSPSQMVEHYSKGLSRLVAEGDLTRNEAREARGAFADWAEANAGDGCEFRDDFIAVGNAFLDFAQVTPGEIRDGFRDDLSLAEIVEDATDGDVSRDELIDYLSEAVGNRLAALEADGALTPEVRDAIEERVKERIPTAVDAEGGPPIKHRGHDRR